jgi:hypothetical protein
MLPSTPLCRSGWRTLPVPKSHFFLTTQRDKLNALEQELATLKDQARALREGRHYELRFPLLLLQAIVRQIATVKSAPWAEKCLWADAEAVTMVSYDVALMVATILGVPENPDGLKGLVTKPVRRPEHQEVANRISVVEQMSTDLRDELVKITPTPEPEVPPAWEPACHHVPQHLEHACPSVTAHLVPKMA